MKKNIIITGCAGYLGQNLAIKLRPDFKLFQFENNPKLKKKSYKIKEKIFNIKDLDSKFLQKNQIKIIIHLGWKTKNFFSRNIHTKNFNLSKKIFKLAIQNKCDFIFSSTSAVYGDSFLKKPYLNQYSKKKLMFDNYLKSYFSLKHIRIYSLRLFNIYGKNEFIKKNKASSVFKFIQSLKKTGKIFLYKGFRRNNKYISPAREWLNIDDACSIIKMICIKSLNSNIYDVSCKQKITFDKLANTIINIHGSGKVVYKKVPQSKKKYYQRLNTSTNRHIKNYLNYDFINIEKGIRQYFSEIAV
tara:strand:- start:359 stop:1261 length:903 start_codon:yes stop_codon:yes gene_type:complete